MHKDKCLTDFLRLKDCYVVGAFSVVQLNLALTLYRQRQSENNGHSSIEIQLKLYRIWNEPLKLEANALSPMRPNILQVTHTVSSIALPSKLDQSEQEGGVLHFLLFLRDNIFCFPLGYLTVECRDHVLI